MFFHATFCDPLESDIIDLGDFSESGAINRFESIDWDASLAKMLNVDQSKIFYSPSLEISSYDGVQSIAISVVGEPDRNEFFLFYKRPREQKVLGLWKRVNSRYVSDKTGQSRQDAIDCLKALIRNDVQFLEDKFSK